MDWLKRNGAWLLVAVGLAALFFKDEIKGASRRRTRPEVPAAATETPAPVLTLLKPAAGIDPERMGHIPSAWTFRYKPFPGPRYDVLGMLQIEISNEIPESLGVTEELIRSAADVAYAAIGTHDEDIRGWKLSMRVGDANETNVDAERRQIVLSINPLALSTALPHEMVHVLLGLASGSANAMLPGFVEEFVASSAIIYPYERPMHHRFDYDRLNRPILGVSKSVTGISGRIGMENPLDMERYLLLEFAGEKIGSAAWRTMAHNLAVMALGANEPLSLEDVRGTFEGFGLGDCVLFTKTTAPGIYVDLALTVDGLPYVMYKQVDSNGLESSIAPTSLRLSLYSRGESIYDFPLGQTGSSGVFVDNAAMPVFARADEYRVTLGPHTFKWTVGDAVP